MGCGRARQGVKMYLEMWNICVYIRNTHFDYIMKNTTNQPTNQAWFQPNCRKANCYLGITFISGDIYASQCAGSCF